MALTKYAVAKSKNIDINILRDKKVIPYTMNYWIEKFDFKNINTIFYSKDNYYGDELKMSKVFADESLNRIKKIVRKKIDPNIEKNILFIDIGYSKTSFILSKFKYNEFKVEYVLCDDNLGGRNFDEIIYKHCVSYFTKEIKENIEISNKMKYKLLEEIQKKRIQLSVNNEDKIYVEKFFK